MIKRLTNEEVEAFMQSFLDDIEKSKISPKQKYDEQEDTLEQLLNAFRNGIEDEQPEASGEEIKDIQKELERLFDASPKSCNPFRGCPCERYSNEEDDRPTEIIIRIRL